MIDVQAIVLQVKDIFNSAIPKMAGNTQGARFSIEGEYEKRAGITGGQALFPWDAEVVRGHEADIKSLVVGDKESAFASRNILVDLETVYPNLTECADLSPLERSAVALCAVLQHEDIVSLGDSHYCVHVAWCARHVHDSDELCAFSDLLLQITCIHIETVIHLAQDRDGIVLNHGRYSSDP